MSKVIASILKKGLYDTVSPLHPQNPLLLAGIVKQQNRAGFHGVTYVFTEKGKMLLGEFESPNNGIEVHDFRLKDNVLKSVSVRLGDADYEIVKNAVLGHALVDGSEELKKQGEYSMARIVELTESDFLVLKKK